MSTAYERAISASVSPAARRLRGGELGFATEFHAVRHGALAALPRALADQLALEFGNGGQQRREQPTLWARRVPQRIAKRPECGARLADAVNDIKQLAGRPAESV